MQKSRFPFIVCLCLLLCLLSCSKHRFFSCRAISENDKIEMTSLFKNLIAKDQFGYVLVDTKPVAISSHFYIEPLWNLVFLHKFYTFDPQIAWDIFEKTSSKFHSKRFLLFKESSSLSATSRNLPHATFTFVIINKQCFLQTVTDNLDLFRQTLGPEITPENLLFKVAQKKQSLFEIVGCDEALYGILLGYGRSNALAFKRYHKIGELIDPHFSESSPRFCLHRIKPSAKFRSIEEEYAYLKSHLIYFSLKTPLSPIDSPAFRALNTDEKNIDLQQKYAQAHKHLLDMYYDPDFLQLVFNQLLEK